MRYLVTWTLHWELVEFQALEPGCDLRAAMTMALESLVDDGWVVESDAAAGFVFINRAGERRLLMLTGRDPQSATPQSFSPF